MTTGNVTSASSEPTFESAYRRYTAPCGRASVNHFCNSGLVELSAKNGRPTVTASSHAIRHVGESGLDGFHAPPR